VEEGPTYRVDAATVSKKAHAENAAAEHKDATVAMNDSVLNLSPGSRDYVRDLSDPKLLATLRAAVDADPELKGSTLDKRVNQGKVYREDIESLQTSLQNKGYDVGGGKGMYGYRTDRAVQQYLADLGRTATETPDGAQAPAQGAYVPHDAKPPGSSDMPAYGGPAAAQWMNRQVDDQKRRDVQARDGLQQLEGKGLDSASEGKAADAVLQKAYGGYSQKVAGDRLLFAMYHSCDNHSPQVAPYLYTDRDGRPLDVAAQAGVEAYQASQKNAATMARDHANAQVDKEVGPAPASFKTPGEKKAYSDKRNDAFLTALAFEAVGDPTSVLYGFGQEYLHATPSAVAAPKK